MVTPAEIIRTVASLQNDTAQTVYTNAAVLPYLNVALRELQETFQLNNVPVTNETTPVVINVPAGVSTVRFPQPGQEEALPELPVDLVEIRQLWESAEGQNLWIPMVKKTYLPHQLQNDQPINQFLIWAWIKQEIRLIAADQDNDLKIDYIASMFKKVEIGQVDIPFPYINIQSALEFRTASLCSMYIGENETRAQALNNDAIQALDRTLGISTKGQQAITTRRRPFRGGFKRVGILNG